MKFYDKVSSNEMIAKYAIYGSLFFFLLSSPEVYTLTNSVVGSRLNVDPACPSLNAVCVHTVVYVLCVMGMMTLGNH